MISHILVPTDFSPVANNALKYAIGLCKRTNASLHVLHIQTVPVIDPTYTADIYQSILKESEVITKTGFKSTEESILQSSGVVYELHNTIGFVSDEIVEFSKNKGIDLIIMGTTGASGLQEILVGSNAASVIGKSDIPVLIIPPTSYYKDAKHILYSSDYTEPEFPAVSRLMYFAELFDARVTILHVKTNFDNYFDAEHNFFVRNRANISHEDITIVNKEDMEVTDAIEKHIEEHKVDMLVMAKHSRSFFDRLFHRSLSKQMAYHTRIPLLILHK